MSASFHLSKSRVETLVDGVFAIAMTLLILEVKVPELENPRSVAELLGSLHHALPTAIAYFLSFFMLGWFWVWHHRLTEKVSGFDLPLFAVTLAFLSLVSSFPFAAALFGRYLGNVATLVVYLPVVGLILVCQTAFLVIARNRGLIRDEVSAEEVRTAHRRNLIGLFYFFLGTVPGALPFGWIATGVCAAAAIAVFILYKRA
ncbi:MAG: TMEM175 family protein [Acidobacteriota bacterium]